MQLRKGSKKYHHHPVKKHTLLRSLLVSLPQVNGQNVVKVGHRQVVNMIRQGGNSLMVKVVMVTRNPDMDDGSRKKSRSIQDK